MSLTCVMGCDVSKTADVSDCEEVPGDSFEFTDTQIDTIRSTWPLLARDMSDVGSKVFLGIFVQEPKIKQVFVSFGKIEEHELVNQPIFISHVTKFMQAIDTVVDSLDRPKCEVQQQLMMLGARHATFAGFHVSFFPIFMKVLLEVWESTIGEEYIPEVRDCWTLFFAYIVRNLCQGYDLYTNDCQESINEDPY